MAASERETERPRGGLLRKFLIALGSSVVVVAIAELGARLALGESFVAGERRGDTWRVCGRFDPDFGWTNEEGARAHVANGKIDYHVRINSHGFRDPEREPHARQGVKRVALLGDSVAWGWGVDEGERFSDLVEARLAPDVEFLNFAVPGYGTDQQLWTLVERASPYAPDLVVLCFILNDLKEIEGTTNYGMPKPRVTRGDDGAWRIENRPVDDPRTAWQRVVRGGWRTVAAHSGLVCLIESWQRDPNEEVRERTPSLKQFKRRQREEVPLVRAAADRLVDESSVVHTLLRRVKAECDARGVPLVLFTIAHKHDQYLYEPALPLPPVDETTEFRCYLTRRIAQASAMLGIESLSVDQAMLDAVREGETLHCGDGHLNEAGNEVVAKELEPVIRRMLGLD